MITDKRCDEIKLLCKKIENIELTTREEVKKFVRDYTTLIWNYKMVGKIYDYYKEDVEILRENRVRLKGVDKHIEDILEVMAAFPDIEVHIENIIVSGDSEKGYKIFRRMRYTGTNLGYSKYGKPTNKELGDSCLGLSMFYINKVDDSWKITHEMDMRSSEWFKDRMTL